MEITDRRVLITGANRGLGRALTLGFVDAGAREVFAGTRTESDLVKFTSDRVTPIILDVTNDGHVAETRRLGTIDILVNNAGVASYGNPVNMNFADAANEMNVNYFGALRMTRALAPAMTERGEGMIVNIATAFARINLPLIGTYCASKSALLSLGQALRAYLGDRGVHVMTVMPTTIDTDMSRGADVPKMTVEFVTNEILRHIRAESIDPPIGEEAERILEGVRSDPVALEKVLSQIKA
ncbi:MAG TPA: SDR family NAD(P)-dependent oxidoreductase [Tepidisphaeraceae bacterium]|jgi:short-subunit dehydrogenase|nr:SDR family NAD(P)-dependent oxidoreductase [Tepidisphaeraceae bacterium]